MNQADTYRKYAADCIGLARREDSAEAKNIMVNMALAWIRLAQQKQAMAEPTLVPEQGVPEVPADDSDAAAKARAH